MKLFIVALPHGPTFVRSVAVFKDKNQAESYLANAIDKSRFFVYQEHVREIDTDMLENLDWLYAE